MVQSRQREKLLCICLCLSLQLALALSLSLSRDWVNNGQWGLSRQLQAGSRFRIWLTPATGRESLYCANRSICIGLWKSSDLMWASKGIYYSFEVTVGASFDQNTVSLLFVIKFKNIFIHYKVEYFEPCWILVLAVRVSQNTGIYILISVNYHSANINTAYLCLC